MDKIDDYLQSFKTSIMCYKLIIPNSKFKEDIYGNKICKSLPCMYKTNAILTGHQHHKSCCHTSHIK